jgi:hypothetical protein
MRGSSLIPAGKLAGPSRQPDTVAQRGGAVLVAFLLACVGLLVAGALTSLGLHLRYDSIFIPLALAAALRVLASLPPPLAWTGLAALSVSFFGTVLLGVWGSAVSDLSILAGLFPHNDARSYLDGSLRLLHDGELTVDTSRRPLSVSTWTLLLFLTGSDFRWASALMALLTALALALPVREAIRTHGWAAGGLQFLGLLFFYRRFVGTTLTEHVGLMLGCVGCALLWRSAGNGRKALAILGTLVLSLALFARAGAFFVLPALALWAGLAWRGRRRFSARTALLIFVAAAAGFAINGTVLRALGHPASSQGNFSYTLYGLVHDGDWRQVLRDHPEVRSLSNVERYQRIYDLAIARIISRPWSLPQGMARAYRAFFFSTQGPYCFVQFALQRSMVEHPPHSPGMSAGVAAALRADPWKYLQIAGTFAWFAALSLLALAGLCLLPLSRRPEDRLLLAVALGILASVPFAPPWDVDLMRVYAATMPFMAALPAVALASGIVRLRRRRAEIPAPGAVGTGTELLAAGVAGALLCLAPLLFKGRDISPEVPAPDRGGESWTVRVLPGSTVRVVFPATDHDSAGAPPPPLVSRNLGILAANRPERAAELSAIPSGSILAMGYEAGTRTLRYLALDEAQVLRLGLGWTRVRAEPAVPGKEDLWWRVHLDPPPPAESKSAQ